MKKSWVVGFLTFVFVLIFFAFPFEHKYDKFFRFYSLTLIPEELKLPISFDKKIYFYFSDFFMLVLLAVGMMTAKTRLWGRGAWLLGVVFFSSLFSLVVSPYSHYPLVYIRLLQLFTPMALFAFLANGSLEKEKILKIVSFSLFASSLMQAGFALSQYFLQHEFGLRVLNEHRLDAKIPAPLSGKLFTFGGSAGVEGIYRACGTFSHPNVLGGFLTVTLLMTLYLFWAYPNKRKWLGWGYVIQCLALATTFSRAAIYGWALGTIFMLFWNYKKVRTSLMPAFLLVSGCLLFTTALFYEQYYRRGGIVNYTQDVRGSDQLRMHYHRVAARMVEKNPWLGVGYGLFSCQGTQFLDPGTDPIVAEGGVHNIYLRLWAETGIFSFMAFLSWLGLLFYAGWRSVPSLETGVLLAVFLALGFIGGCDHYLILFQQGKILFFGMLGLLARFGNFERNPPQIAPFYRVKINQRKEPFR